MLPLYCKGMTALLAHLLACAEEKTTDPVLAVDPASLEFGTVSVGSSATAELINEGSAAPAATRASCAAQSRSGASGM